MKNKQIPKDCCLKSFDGKILGKLNRYITCKVTYSSGGHQNNVFEEMDTLAEWWKTYRSETKEVLIILIDTDVIKKFIMIKDKYSNIRNIMVFNHIEFQLSMIENYYIDERV